MGEKEEQVFCHASALALAMTDEVRREAEIQACQSFITFVSGIESLASFTNRIFHRNKIPGFGTAFAAAKRNGRFGRIQCLRSKESSSRGKRKRRIFLCRRIVIEFLSLHKSCLTLTLFRPIRSFQCSWYFFN